MKRNHWLRLAALALATTWSVTCGDLDMGDITYFSDGFATGDISRWNYDDGRMRGGSYAIGGGRTAVVSDPVRANNKVLSLELPGKPGEQEHVAVTRFGKFPTTMYIGFSALWPRRVEVKSYWKFLQIRGVQSEATNPTDDLMWELGIVTAADGSMKVAVSRQPPGKPSEQLQVIADPLTENQWIRFELRTRLSTEAKGLFELTMNGKQVFREDQVVTGLSDFYRVFFVSNGMDLSPAPVQILIDDVTLSPIPWPTGATLR